MIVNILIDLIQTKLALENFYYLIYIICEISLILFYIIEKYLSKNEEEINKKKPNRNRGYSFNNLFINF